MAVVAIIILNIVNFFVTHPFISGLVIGLVVGAGVAFASILIFRWFQTHKIVEIKDVTELEDGLELEDDTDVEDDTK